MKAEKTDKKLKWRNVKIWFRAHNGWAYWRVKYADGKRTYPLQYDEAKSLAEVFKGELFIDYSIEYYI